MKCRAVYCLVVVLVSQVVTAGNMHDGSGFSLEQRQAITKALQAELEALYNNNVFAGSAIVTSSGEPLMSRSFGFADRSLGKRNTLDTISDIGSVAKTFTAAAVLQLVNDNKLSLSTRVVDVFPSAPKNKQRLTIEGLLAHSSGLDNFHNETDFDAMSKSEALKKIFDLPPVSAPGEKIAYSNAGYTLLAAIVEAATGQGFQEYVRDNIIEPLGLKNTGFYGDAKIDTTMLAKGYGGVDSGETTFEKSLTWALIGQGGMVSSTRDLSVWLGAVLTGALFADADSNPMLLEANRLWLLGNIRHFDSWGALSYYAGGSTDFGYTALIQHLPKYDVSIVLLLNAYGDRYENAVHQKISKHHIFPVVLQHAN